MAKKQIVNADGSITTVKGKKPIYKKIWFWILVLVVLGSIGNMLGGSDNKEPTSPQNVVAEEKVEKDEKTPEELAKEAEEDKKAKEERLAEEKKKEEEAAKKAEEEAKKAEEEAKQIKAGSYRVGTDIPAGEYKVFSKGFTYLEVASNSSGSLDSIVTNDNISTFTYITVEDGQYFSFNNGYALHVDDVEPFDASNGYGTGQYKVGFDIPAGEYNIIADGHCYIEVSSDSTGSLWSIITNDNIDTNKFISVADGQYLTITSGKIE